MDERRSPNGPLLSEVDPRLSEVDPDKLLAPAAAPREPAFDGEDGEPAALPIVPSSPEERQARFQELILPEVDFIARISRSMSRNASEAEDLAQDTLLKAFRALDSFDGRHARAWLFRIARNTAINRDHRQRDVLLNEDDDLDRRAGAGAVSSDPAIQSDDQSLDELLERALDSLPTSFRVVIDLVDIGGLRYQEAADLLDIPVGTVMSRLHRARARLRDAISGSHLDPERFDDTPEPVERIDNLGGATEIAP